MKTFDWSRRTNYKSASCSYACSRSKKSYDIIRLLNSAGLQRLWTDDTMAIKIYNTNRINFKRLTMLPHTPYRPGIHCCHGYTYAAVGWLVTDDKGCNTRAIYCYCFVPPLSPPPKLFRQIVFLTMTISEHTFSLASDKDFRSHVTCILLLPSDSFCRRKYYINLFVEDQCNINIIARSFFFSQKNIRHYCIVTNRRVTTTTTNVTYII